MKNITIAYIPALHQGYISFLKKYQDQPLYLLDDELLTVLAQEEPYYGRDIRAVPTVLMKQAIENLGLVPEVRLLNQATISNLQQDDISVVAPDEDISEAVVKKFLPQVKVEYVSTFLRWDKKISQKEFEIPPDRVISYSDLDQELMSAATDESQKSPDWWRQIGAVAVKEGRVILAAHNKNLPRPDNPNVLGDPRSNFDAGVRIDLVTTIHAEAAVVAEAARQGISLLGASLYTTTFPCPPCARLLISAGIKKVFYAQGYSLLDSEELLKRAGVEIILVKNQA